MRSSTLIAAITAAAFAAISPVASSSNVNNGQAAGQLAARSNDDGPLRILAPRMDNKQQQQQSRDLVAPPVRSRHASRDHRALARKVMSNSEASPSQQHVKKSSQLKKRQSSSKKCKAKTSNSSSGNSDGSSESSSSSGSSSSSRGTVGDKQTSNSTGAGSSGSGATDGIDFDLSSNFLKIGNIYAGFLPDDGSGGGKAESMSQINSILPAKSAFYGRYAQVTNGKTFDGSQLYHVMDDITASGAILQASVMPYKTWDGLTESDNRNAVAVAKVCNDIYEKHGVEVWLRFAHEMNWYQTDGTYSGSVQDFQTGWKVMSAAIREHAPNTKMYWSPNVGSDSDYEKYYPKEGDVHIVGFDWYPNSASESFVDKAASFHDKYAVNGIKMFQGETGLHYSGSDSEKMQWVKSLSSDETQKRMPNYLGWAWFNYDKYENSQQIDFKIVKPGNGNGGVNSMIRSFFAA